MSSKEAVSLISLPPELIERVLLYCHPHDVANFAETSQDAYTLVYKGDDQYLWRELFLAWPFDDLRKAIPPPGISKAAIEHNWRAELQRRVEAESVVLRGVVRTSHRLQRALEALISVVETSLPLTDSPDSEDSDNLQWLDTLLRYATFDTESMNHLERQLLGRLMTYLALSYEKSLNDDPTKKRLNELRRKSRSYVYDLRRYTEETAWGPFMRSEKKELVVNWEHMEHIINVVALKLRELPLMALRLYNKPRPGLAATQAFSAPFAHDRKPHDWAGIAGVWRRFVCFMDYRDLFAFNFSVSSVGPRDPSFFDDEYQEAIRPVELHLEVIDPEVSSTTSSTESTTLINPNYPPIVFKGYSRGAHSSDAAVEGSVSLLADGGIRWTFVTKYDGLTQWSAEGVQIGNICSAAGVAGIWTGAFHEEGDPAGPFWMWKVPGPLPEGFHI